MPPTDGAHAGNEALPVRGQNENENRRKKPKCSLHQMRADDAFQKRVQPLD